MADASQMTDEEWNAEMARQAKEIAEGGDPPPVQVTLPAQPAGAPMQQPTDPRAAVAAAQMNAPVNPAPQPPVPQQQQQQQVQAAPQQQAPDPYGRLMNLSNQNTATTLGAMNRNQEELYKAQQDKADAIRREAVLNAHTDADVARTNQAYLNEMHEMRAQQSVAEQNRQHDVDIEMDKQQAIMEDIRKSQVDPNEVWKHGAIFGEQGSRIFSAIGIGLAGMMPGGAEEAAGIVNHEIDRSVNAQRANLEKKKDLLGAQQNIVGIYRQQFQDGAQADEAARMALRETAIDHVEQMRLNAKSTLEMSNADKLIAGLKADFAKDQQSFLQSSNAIVTQGIMQQGNLQSAKDENLYRQGMLATKGNAQMDSKLYVPGAGYALDEDSAKKAREAMVVQKNIQASLEKLKGLRKEHGGGFTMDRSAVKEASNAKEFVKRGLQKLFEMGVLQKYEDEQIDKFLPDADGYSPLGSTEAAYDALSKTLAQQTENGLSQYINPALAQRRQGQVREQVVVGPGR